MEYLYEGPRAAAKEYLFHHIAALKLTEKTQDELLADLDTWEKREELARSRNVPSLAAKAEKEVGRIRAKAEALAVEIAGMRATIEKLRKELPSLAAQKRTVDPAQKADLLEQELLITLGKNPRDEIQNGNAFKTVEADAALEALKAKMAAKDTAP
ncbi:MAG: chromosome partitioning protein [Treponema sp.]|nr:chromosome partitioning protein [Treponema sp.]